MAKATSKFSVNVIATLSESLPQFPSQGCGGKRCDKRSHHEDPAADAKHCAARKRLTARASSSQHGAEAHEDAADRCCRKSSRAADLSATIHCNAPPSKYQSGNRGAYNETAH